MNRAMRKLTSTLLAVIVLVWANIGLSADPKIEFDIQKGELRVGNQVIRTPVSPEKIRSDEEFVRIEQAPNAKDILVMILRHSGSEFWILDKNARHPPEKAPFTTGMNIVVKWHGDVIEVVDTRHGYTNNYLLYLDDLNVWKEITNMIRYERDIDIYLSEPTIGKPEVKMNSFLTSKFDQDIEFNWDQDMVQVGWTSITDVVVKEDTILITFSYPKKTRTIEFPRLRTDS
jgi:hypothetical protein